MTRRYEPRIAFSLAFTLLCASTSNVAAAQTSAAAPATALTPYTAPDQSASAGVPSGWKVDKGEQTVIIMRGPQHEVIQLGTTVIARNAPFQLNEAASGGVDMSMPFQMGLGQKLTMILARTAAVTGQPAPQISIVSVTPLSLPATMGQCGKVIADYTGARGPTKIVALLCSLPMDRAGLYKTMYKLAQAPIAVAQQSAPVAAAIFASYRIPPAMLQRKLAPVTAPVVMPRGTVRAGGTPGADQQGSLDAAECFDLTVLRETPRNELPRKCGGTAPDR
jgi:hypothetical protein